VRVAIACDIAERITHQGLTFGERRACNSTHVVQPGRGSSRTPGKDRGRARVEEERGERNTGRAGS